MSTFGRNRNKRRARRKWASGKKAFVICDRSGFKIPLSRSVVEPGTGLRVDKSWSDGAYNRIDHPQNFPADVGEAIAINNSRPVFPPMSSFLADDNGVLILVDDGGQPIFIEE